MIGGGTNELQHLIIARRLLAQHPLETAEKEETE
jgi:hypothetical protein